MKHNCKHYSHANGSGNTKTEVLLLKFAKFTDVTLSLSMNIIERVDLTPIQTYVAFENY